MDALSFAFSCAVIRGLFMYLKIAGSPPRDALPVHGCNDGSPISRDCKNPDCCVHWIDGHGSGRMTQAFEILVYGSQNEASVSQIVNAFVSTVDALIRGGDKHKNPHELFSFIQIALHALTYAGEKIGTPTKREDKNILKQQKKSVCDSFTALMKFSSGISREFKLSELYRFVPETRGTYSSSSLKSKWGLVVKPCIPMHREHLTCCSSLMTAKYILKNVDEALVQQLVAENKLDTIAVYRPPQSVSMFPASYGVRGFDDNYCGVSF
jgi:hypothetical protein